jgi:hypothetical protein
MEAITRKRIFAGSALVLELGLIAYQRVLVEFGFFDERLFWILSLTAAALTIFAGVLLLRNRIGMASSVGLAICMLSLAFLITQFVNVLWRDFHVAGRRS